MINLEIFSGKTLLIVDDEPDLREPLVNEFESLGCQVFQAANGRDAFELVKHNQIDAVVSDVRMPGGSGVELLRNIKALHHKFPIVMLMTGFTDLSREDAYDLGAEAILAKPFDLDQLNIAVAKLLTPHTEKWCTQEDGYLVKANLEQEFVSLAEAVKNGHFNIGRGGAFIKLDANFPNLGEIVSLRVCFKEGSTLVIEGQGVIRWVRVEQAEGYLSGCGIEFEHLTAPSKAAIVGLTESLELKSFIPKK